VAASNIVVASFLSPVSKVCAETPDSSAAGTRVESDSTVMPTRCESLFSASAESSADFTIAAKPAADNATPRLASTPLTRRAASSRPPRLRWIEPKAARVSSTARMRIWARAVMVLDGCLDQAFEPLRAGRSMSWPRGWGCGAMQPCLS
jgi:hypothetical protein